MNEIVTYTIGSLVPILMAFPSYTIAKQFAMVIRPSFADSVEDHQLRQHFTEVIDLQDRIFEFFDNANKLHFVMYYQGTQIKMAESWYENYNNSPKEYWFENSGMLHRLDGPAYIRYFNNGSICYESWKQKGVTHREIGPAWIEYEYNGQIKQCEWWVDGKKTDHFIAERWRD